MYEAIPVVGYGGPNGREKSRFPYFLANRFTDGGDVVSLTHRPRFTLEKYSWYSFLLRAEYIPRI
jgi:hypothetical protein